MFVWTLGDLVGVMVAGYMIVFFIWINADAIRKWFKGK